jgi:hypothetical protein
VAPCGPDPGAPRSSGPKRLNARDSRQLDAAQLLRPARGVGTPLAILSRIHCCALICGAAPCLRALHKSNTESVFGSPHNTTGEPLAEWRT